jgi:hypothetical protein
VDADVVPLRFDPVDRRQRHGHDPAALAHEQPPRGGPECVGGEVVARDGGRGGLPDAPNLMSHP